MSDLGRDVRSDLLCQILMECERDVPNCIGLTRD